MCAAPHLEAPHSAGPETPGSAGSPSVPRGPGAKGNPEALRTRVLRRETTGFGRGPRTRRRPKASGVRSPPLRWACEGSRPSRQRLRHWVRTWGGRDPARPGDGWASGRAGARVVGPFEGGSQWLGPATRSTVLSPTEKVRPSVSGFPLVPRNYEHKPVFVNRD